MRGRIGFLVQIEDVRHFVFLEHGVSVVHFAHELVQHQNGSLLVLDNAALQVGQAVEGEVVHAQLWVDEDNLRLLGCVGAGDA